MQGLPASLAFPVPWALQKAARTAGMVWAGKLQQLPPLLWVMLPIRTVIHVGLQLMSLSCMCDSCSAYKHITVLFLTCLSLGAHAQVPVFDVTTRLGQNPVLVACATVPRCFLEVAFSKLGHDLSMFLHHVSTACK